MRTQKIFLLGLTLLLTVSAYAQGDLPRRPVFGAPIGPLNAQQRSERGIAENEGLILGNPVPNLSAAAAGLRNGDILLSVNGSKVNSPALLVPLFATIQSGSTVEYEIFRDGKRVKVTGKAAERPRDNSDQYQTIYGHVVSNGKRMRTVITRPKSSGKFPVLMLVQGLGPGSVDILLSSTQTYASILRPFATSGYVTVRVDKPGVGDSEGGPYEQVDYLTELDIYRQTLKALQTMEFVDQDKIFIFGHSMGGAFGPMLSNEFKLRGLAVYGTVSKNWNEYFAENTRRQELLAGSSYEAVDETLRSQMAANHMLLVDMKTPEQVKKERPDLAAAVDAIAGGGLMYGRVMSFWQQIAKVNFPAHWLKSNCHVLSIWGENDFISTEYDHQLIAEIVNSIQPGKGRYLRLVNSDHGFKTTNSLKDSFARWGQPGGEFNQIIVTELQKWMESASK